jgi:hypothetical protein
MVISRLVRHDLADCGTRQDAVVLVLPSYGEWRELPVMRSRHAGTVRVGALMARGAGEPRNSSVLSSANHIELVTMTVVSLLGIIRGGVAVDAPGMTEDGVDLIPRREPLGAARLRTRWGSRLLSFGALNRCHSTRCRNQQCCDGHMLKRFHGDTPSFAAQRGLGADWRCDIVGVSVPVELWTIWIDTSKILLASL